jgi:hypothetical protein
MVITFTYVTFCHKQQYSERTYLSYHQRLYSERTYDNTCFLPIELLMTISYENMILNKSMILHLYNYAKEKVLKWTPLCKMQLGLKPEVNLFVLAPG